MRAQKSLSGLQLVEQTNRVEASLWRRLRFEHEPSCRLTLFDRYGYIARQVATREFASRPAYGLERGDFLQLAHQGFLEAIDRYDPLRGIPFEVFARYRIAGAISDGTAKSSEGAAQYVYRRRVEAERLRSLRSGEPDSGDALTELARQAIGLAIGFMLGEVTSIDDLPEAEQPIDPYQSLSWRDMLSSARRAIGNLPPAEHIVISEHYLKGVPFGQIAELMALSKGRVSQLHRAGLERIRQMLGTF